MLDKRNNNTEKNWQKKMGGKAFETKNISDNEKCSGK